MSSSEEYLDNLLKSLMEGGQASDTEAASQNLGGGQTQSASDDLHMTEDFSLDELTLPEDVMDETGSVAMPANGADSDTDKAMSMDEIEAMLSSMGDADTDKQAEEDSLLEDISMEMPMFGEEDKHESGLEDLDLSEFGFDDLAVEDDVPDTEEKPADLKKDNVMDNILTNGTEGADLSLDDISLDNFAIEEPSLDIGTEDGDMSEEDIARLLKGDSINSHDYGRSAADAISLDNIPMMDDLDAADSMEDLKIDTGLLGDMGLSDDISITDGLDFGDDLALTDEAGTTDDLSVTDSLGFGDDLSLTEDMGLLGDMGLSDDISVTDGLDFGDDLALTDDLSLTDGPGGSDDLALTDDFALEDYGESDEDLSALLAGMEQNEDLSEINDLLERSDQGVSVDDDMLAMLESVPEGEAGESGSDAFDFFAGEEAIEGDPENIREITEEELESRKESRKAKKERKKQEKKAKKDRKKKGIDETDGGETGELGSEETAMLESLLEGTGAAEVVAKPEKPGIFARILAFLLEEDEEDEPVNDNAADDMGLDILPIGNPSEENKQLLEELSEEDKKNAGKKGKKEKKKKEKKGKKAAAELDEEEAENEEKNKARKKKKKKKKEKAPEAEEPKEPEKKLSKKKVIAVFLYCATMAACIIVIVMVVPGFLQKRDARVAFDYQNYDEVYELLVGKELSEEDELLFKKSSLILQMERKLDSYENYEKLDMPLEALDALISGVDVYHSILQKAEEYNMTGEVSDIYDQILERLSAYGVSESEALDIIASGDNVTYSQRLESILNGGEISAESGEQQTQDILPEEEEIIDRLEQLEQPDVAEGEDGNGNDGAVEFVNGSGELSDSGENYDEMSEEAELE